MTVPWAQADIILVPDFGSKAGMWRDTRTKLEVKLFVCAYFVVERRTVDDTYREELLSCTTRMRVIHSIELSFVDDECYWGFSGFL